MMDALKLAEEALEMALTFDHTCDHTNTHRGGAIWTICDDCGREWADDKGGFQPDPPNKAICQVRTALTAIRAARDEWGWRPIAEMEEEEPQPVVVGKYPKFRKNAWVTSDGWKSKKAAQMSGYTHFYRPQLPPPPTREEAKNG